MGGRARPERAAGVYVKRILIIITLAVISIAEAADFDPALQLWSVAAITEEDDFDRRLYGVRFREIWYWDDHAPPITAFWGVEALSGDDQTVIRGTTTFSLFAFPMGQRFSLWVRPVAGIEWREEKPDDGFGGILGIGPEFIFRPTPDTQLALSFDWLYQFSETTTQVGLAYRWGKRNKP